jgi:hypothetical protein
MNQKFSLRRSVKAVPLLLSALLLGVPAAGYAQTGDG